MNNYRIVTSGDKNYFKFLWRFENNVFKQFGEYPIIYDLGLTDLQKSNLKSKILKTKVSSDFSEYTEDGFIKAIHKPLCILDFFVKFSSDCLFLDADMLFSRKISKEDFLLDNYDIAVTPRHTTEQYEKLYKNGFINSGTMYFSNNQNTISFVNSWVEECKKENTSDQLALSNLLSNNISREIFFKSKEIKINDLDIKLLDPVKYNDVSLTNGLILHYKNAGRMNKAFKRYSNEYSIIQNSLPIRNIYLFSLKVKRLLNRLS